jgi:hypothetical protein
MDKITKNNKTYNLCSINHGSDNFTYDYEDHCSDYEPDAEFIYEDENGSEYVVYKKDGVIVSEFENID